MLIADYDIKFKTIFLDLRQPTGWRSILQLAVCIFSSFTHLFYSVTFLIWRKNFLQLPDQFTVLLVATFCNQIWLNRTTNITAR